MLLQGIQKYNHWLSVVSTDCLSLLEIFSIFPVSVIFHQTKKCLGSTGWEVYYFQMSCLAIYINTIYANRFITYFYFTTRTFFKILFFYQITTIWVYFSIKSNTSVLIRIIDIWEAVMAIYLNLTFFNFQ